jgi:hypothetical protein
MFAPAAAGAMSSTAQARQVTWSALSRTANEPKTVSLMLRTSFLERTWPSTVRRG